MCQQSAGRRASMARPQSLSKIDEMIAASASSLAEGLDRLSSTQPSPSSDPHRRSGSLLQSLTNDSSSWAPGQRAGVLSGSAVFTPLTLGYILVWYVTGALTNSTSKQALSQWPKGEAPWMSLTLMQHMCATVAGTVALRVLGFRRYKPLPPSAQTWGFYRMVLVYSIGFCLTNGAFGAVNASFVDTIKAGEPLATMLLTVLFLSDGPAVTLPIFLSLLPIVGGVSISSMSEASFSWIGFLMAMGSNICFSARSICAKMLKTELGRSMDNASLFLHVNAYGVALLLPAVLFFEGPVLATLLTSGGKAARLFVLNGLLYYINNQMNFLVLEKVDAVTHGLINCGRRIANIGFAIVWFGIPVTLYNGIGISLAIAGAFLYMKAKQMSAKPISAPPSRVASRSALLDLSGKAS